MRNQTHNEQIIRWANYVKSNLSWKKELKEFLDGQIIMAEKIYNKLAQSNEGRKKIKLLREYKSKKSRN